MVLLRWLRMPEFEEEYRKYKERGFPDEIAGAKAFAHTIAPKTPGVWREILLMISEAEFRRENIIVQSPDGFEEEVRELLACTRTIKEMHQGILHCGWFYVKYEGQGWYVVRSANHYLPVCVGEEEYEAIDDDEDEYAQAFKFRVCEDIPTILRSNGDENAEYEWIGLCFNHCSWLLEVKRSERGIKAIEQLERKIEEKWKERMEVMMDE